MKLLITSPDALIDNSTGDFFPGIIDALNLFTGLSKGNEVVVVSNHSEKLEPIDLLFTCYNLEGDKWIRKSPDLIKYISKKKGVDYNDIIVLGCKDDDMILAANAKILLLTGIYAINNNPKDRIYIDGYGLRVSDIDKLKQFFNQYLDIDVPWFFSLHLDDETSIYGLTNAMTRSMSNRTEIEICSNLRRHLKDGHDKGKNPFRIYSLLSFYRIFKDVNDIHYWGYYPSSDGKMNDALFYLKEILRKSFGVRNTNDLLIRFKPSVKRSQLSALARENQGCDTQFDSLHINPYFKGKLKDKNICIIDDFSTHGTSSETVRHLFKCAGVNKVLFVSLGKFKLTYKIYNYELKGDIFSPNYDYKRISKFNEVRGTINNESTEDLINSLKDSY